MTYPVEPPHTGGSPASGVSPLAWLTLAFGGLLFAGVVLYTAPRLLDSESSGDPATSAASAEPSSGSSPGSTTAPTPKAATPAGFYRVPVEQSIFRVAAITGVDAFRAANRSRRRVGMQRAPTPVPNGSLSRPHPSAARHASSRCLAGGPSPSLPPPRQAEGTAGRSPT